MCRHPAVGVADARGFVQVDMDGKSVRTLPWLVIAGCGCAVVET